MKIPDDEQRADLDLWVKNGCGSWHRGQGKNLPKVSIGRTDSERGLGFVITAPSGRQRAEFVLDRCQVEDLHDYLGQQIRRLRNERGCILTKILARVRRQRRRPG